MIRLAILGTALVLLLPSCGGDAAAAGKDPAAVAKGFVDAVNSRDEQAFLSLVTSGARKAFESDSGLSLNDKSFTNATLLETELDGETARVPIEFDEDGERKRGSVHMRQQEGAWRVFAVGLTMPNGAEFTVEFERLGVMTQAIASAISSGLQTSFEEHAKKHALRERERKTRLFRAMRVLAGDAPGELWPVSKDVSGRPAGEVLAELASRIGLAFDAGAHALDDKVTVDVAGVSCAEAIDRIATSLDLHAVFPEASSAMQSDEESRPIVTLAKGPRPLPAVWSGPFMVAVTDLTENVPHATGDVQVTVRAFGMNDALVGLLEDLGEITKFARIVDDQNKSLRTREDVRYLGGGVSEGPIWESSTRLELRNLLRRVSKIARVEGTQLLALPSRVHEIEWSSPAAGQEKRAGDLVLTVRQVGQSFSFDITGPKEQLADFSVRAMAKSSTGEYVNVQFTDATKWRDDKVRVNVQTEQPATSFHVKLVAREVREHPFVLADVPLSNHGRMPERIEPLAFDGHKRPLDIKFLAFGETGPGPASIRIQAINHSNKEVTTVSAELVYLDGARNVLKDFPTTIQGEFTAAGYGAVAAPRSSSELDTHAFFMPEGTKNILIRILKVEFVDGSTWQRSE